jgi:ABC-type Na+ efflux pump permease subunit
MARRVGSSEPVSISDHRPLTAGLRIENGKAPSIPQVNSIAGQTWQAQTPSKPNSLRIILAIAAKDVREALQNKVLLAVILGALVMVGINILLPRALLASQPPTTYVYDQGYSRILRDMHGDGELRFVLVESQAEIADALTSGPNTSLGLALPADFDQQVSAGQPLKLSVSVAHWADQANVNLLREQFSQWLSRGSGVPVQLELADQPVYPALNGGGQPMMVAQLGAILLLLVGITLTSLLVVEEKEAHTLEALFVSPANPAQVVAGKALVGLVYGLAAAAILLLLNSYLIVNWEVAVLAVLSGLIFAVALGLLLGALSNNPNTLGLWSGLLILVLVVMALIKMFERGNLPPMVDWLVSWFPSGAMINLLWAAMTQNPAAGTLAGQSGLLLLLAAGLFALAGWWIGRLMKR